MVFDLTVFDWSAIGSIGQVASTVATIVSLWLLWRQIRLTKDQVKEAQESLRLAMTEVEENRKQAEQARHDAVIPVLSVIHTQTHSGSDSRGNPIGYASDRPMYWVCSLRNDGFGPARDVRVLGPDGHEAAFCSAIPASDTWEWSVTLGRPIKDCLISVEWRDVFNKPYSMTFVMNEDPTMFRVSVSKGSGGFVQQIVYRYKVGN
ncbi:MAG TPA: hypothetical protein VD973_09430 [Symbiobacteriaceae bacterium]|nr:hypothetical protein [Symbiobacteriaceae bacterium]